MAVVGRGKSSVVLSSVPLQMLLYLNVIYYVFYFLATLLMLIYKSQVFSYPGSNLALDLCLLFLMGFLEPLQLYLGTRGNLAEEKITLGSSLVVTVGNIFLAIYFLTWQTYILRADLIINIILIVIYGLAVTLKFLTMAAFFH
ncbi:transmembrane protein 80 [Xenopus laevis]|uniref:Transmembrane protein 80 n=2 Tax=Xenopus laevis TaxID=8355 RepID=A0A974HNE7_XENLA|nr:transmembrane protein 80 [Xenopus laevis]OCT84001.1 hypothetical protein XELAEV_18022139mg [Xenopus laevis]